jgi:uncharacterized cupredoxin-like copper-binding protein
MILSNTRRTARDLVFVLLAAASMAAAAHEPKPGSHHDDAAFEQKPWGIAADPKSAGRIIEVEMSDAMRFTPSTVKVRQGEVVKFVLHNRGKMLHEMVIGTPHELQAHAALMQKFPDMEHDEAHMTHVKAGGTGDLVWKFNRAGQFEFACLIPGHFQAGMVGTIVVAPAAH